MHLAKTVFHFLISMLLLFAISIGALAEASSTVPAKKLFGRQKLPADMKARVHGGYTKGCISGAMAVPFDGPTWQAMRLSRNRRWGHPDLVHILEDLSIKASKKGWRGLLIGDMSQPRGGPMLTGHRSHQIGLDADIWFMPMPEKRMTYKERENTSAVSVLKRKSNYVDDSRWTRGHTNVLHLAAQYPEVERILVHPGVKKKLCDTVKGDRKWLRKIRPFWGHHYHFHLRIGCPANSPGCKPQNRTPDSTGCGKSLAWWFNVGLAPKKKIKKSKKKKKKKKKVRRPRHVMLADLPEACTTILNAPATKLETATLKIKDRNFVAPQLNVPVFNASAVMKSKPIEAARRKISKTRKKTALNEIDLSEIAVPTLRPKR